MTYSTQLCVPRLIHQHTRTREGITNDKTKDESEAKTVHGEEYTWSSATTKKPCDAYTSGFEFENQRQGRGRGGNNTRYAVRDERRESTTGLERTRNTRERNAWGWGAHVAHLFQSCTCFRACMWAVPAMAAHNLCTHGHLLVTETHGSGWRRVAWVTSRLGKQSPGDGEKKRRRIVDRTDSAARS